MTHILKKETKFESNIYNAWERWLESNDETQEEKNPLVSVIIPHYNDGKNVRISIYSILKQKYKNWELIIVDDCSNKKNYRLLYSALKKINIKNTIKLVKNRINYGCYNSINIGTSLSSGDYITFLGSDDYFHEDKLFEQVKILKSKGYLATICKYIRYKEDAIVEKRVGESTIMFKKELLKLIGYYDNTRFGGDTEYTERIKSYFGNSSINVIQKILYFAKKRDNSLTSTIDKNKRSVYIKKKREWQKICKKNEIVPFVNFNKDKFLFHINIVPKISEFEEQYYNNNIIFALVPFNKNTFQMDTCINCLQKQTLPLKIIIVGSKDQRIKYNKNISIVDHNKTFLKENFAWLITKETTIEKMLKVSFDILKNYYFDAIVINQSNIFLGKDWIKRNYENVKNGYDSSKNNKKIVHNISNNNFYEQIVNIDKKFNIGALISKNFLEIINWNTEDKTMMDQKINYTDQIEEITIMTNIKNKFIYDTDNFDKNNFDKDIFENIKNEFSSDNKRIVCIIAMYGRHDIVRINVEMLQKQTKKLFKILLVVSTPKDIKFAQELASKHPNIDHLYSVNQPLGLKWQNGVSYSKNYSPDAILINGSDDILSLNWVKKSFEYIKNGCDISGKNEWFFCEPLTKKLFKSKYIHNIIKKDYKPYTVGAGRMLSKNILDKMNWQVYPINKPKGLDTASLIKILKYGGKAEIINDNEIFILSVKGTWSVITEKEIIKRAKTISTLDVTSARDLEYIEKKLKVKNFFDYLKLKNIK